MRLWGRVLSLCAAVLLVAGCDLRPVTDQVSAIDTFAAPTAAEGSGQAAEDAIPHVVAEPIEAELSEALADVPVPGENRNEHRSHADPPAAATPSPPASPTASGPPGAAPAESDDDRGTAAPEEPGSATPGRDATRPPTADPAAPEAAEAPEPVDVPDADAPASEPTPPPAAAERTPSPSASVPLSAIERQIADMLNAERTAAGLRPVRVDARLTHGARAWATTMARGGAFAHESEGGFSENIAYGYADAAEVHDAWMASAGHRDNRLRPGLTSYGIGVRAAGTTLYFVERFQ